jgi:hypothetical protein
MENITISPTVPLEHTATIDNHVSANVDTSSISKLSTKDREPSPVPVPRIGRINTLFPFQQEKKEIHEAVQHRGGRLAY